MFHAFLKTKTYDKIAKFTQYNTPNYNSFDSESDEENQYEIIGRISEIPNDRKTTIQSKINKPDFIESDYYCVSYSSKDTPEEVFIKNLANYGCIAFIILTYIGIGYIVACIYKEKQTV